MPLPQTPWAPLPKLGTPLSGCDFPGPLLCGPHLVSLTWEQTPRKPGFIIIPVSVALLSWYGSYLTFGSLTGKGQEGSFNCLEPLLLLLASGLPISIALPFQDPVFHRPCLLISPPAPSVPKVFPILLRIQIEHVNSLISSPRRDMSHPPGLTGSLLRFRALRETGDVFPTDPPSNREQGSFLVQLPRSRRLPPIRISWEVLCQNRTGNAKLLEEGTFNFNFLLDLGNFCRHNGKQSEVPYVQVFLESFPTHPSVPPTPALPFVVLVPC